MTDVVRLIHFADLHLGIEAGGRANPASGLNQRIHDVCDRLDEVCACAEQEDVHAVVFAGDAFKNPVSTPTLQSLFAERMRRLARAGVRVFLLVGNHDLPKMASLAHPFSIYDALEVEGVVVGERAQVYRLQLDGETTLQIAALPHFSRQQLLARLETSDDVQELVDHAVHARVERLEAEIDPAHPAVFCGHCHVNQSELSTAQNLFGVSELQVTLSSLASSKAFPYYALGHVHKRQELSDNPFVAYSGSLERVDFGEGESIRITEDGRCRRSGGEDKGFYRFDLLRHEDTWALAGTPSFRTVNARRFVTVRLDVPDADDPNEAVEAALDTARQDGVALNETVVKIAISLEATDRVRLQYRRVKDAVPEAYDVRIVASSPDDADQVRDPRFATRMGEAEALERFLETKDEWAGDRAQLLQTGGALIDEVLG